MDTIILALVTGAAFSLSGLVALLGGKLTRRGRAYATAVAAAILLALAIGKVFPESLETAGNVAIIGFIGGFALLYLIETFTSAHTYHTPEEEMHQHVVAPFLIGLAAHNLADGFSMGVSAQAGGVSSWLLSIGLLIHQLPVGFSLAAVLMDAHFSRNKVIRAAVLLGLAIPAGAIVTLAVPDVVQQFSGLLLSIAGGLLAYMAATHLLPEAQEEHPSRTVGLVFTLTLLTMTLGIVTIWVE